MFTKLSTQPGSVLSAMGVTCTPASQAFIKNDDPAMFYSVVFFAIGAYEFILGERNQRRAK